MSNEDVAESTARSEAPSGDFAAAQPGPYRVLARKYRPTTFAGLIGQEAMVRTLTNAIASGRLAHAFILTGVRGIGKTSTARIIARALNCVGPDGGGGPTAEPCGVCEHCLAISEDRHVDVLEMDAASRTGVDDIRELIDGVRYRPTQARYKVYIIDEVHMLSKHAFNALLKTLEEPPEHVKFVFATTEIRKVPVTVQSRCQRFDLRRVDLETLVAHFKRIVEREGVRVSDAALRLIARAADGSVRDGLSLLDQAIADAPGEVSEARVSDMLGLADRSQTFSLLEAVLGGDIAAALDRLDRQHTDGADPVIVLEDLLDLVHWLTRIKVAASVAEDPGVPELERVRGKDMAAKLSMAHLTRAWQMLLKGLAEVRTAHRPEQAAEMVLVRLAYAADLPSPADAVRSLGEKAPVDAPAPTPSADPPAPASSADAPAPMPRATLSEGARALDVDSAPAPRADAVAPPKARADPATFEDVAALALEKKAAILHANLVNGVHLVHFEPGRIEFSPGKRAPADLAGRLTRFLNENTTRRWVVTVSGEPGLATLAERSEAEAAEAKARVADHPLVRAVMETFPGATIGRIRTVAPSGDGAEAESEDEIPE